MPKKLAGVSLHQFRKKNDCTPSGIQLNNRSRDTQVPSGRPCNRLSSAWGSGPVHPAALCPPWVPRSQNNMYANSTSAKMRSDKAIQVSVARPSSHKLYGQQQTSILQSSLSTAKLCANGQQYSQKKHLLLRYPGTIHKLAETANAGSAFASDKRSSSPQRTGTQQGHQAPLSAGSPPPFHPPRTATCRPHSGSPHDLGTTKAAPPRHVRPTSQPPRNPTQPAFSVNRGGSSSSLATTAAGPLAAPCTHGSPACRISHSDSSSATINPRLWP